MEEHKFRFGRVARLAISNGEAVDHLSPVAYGLGFDDWRILTVHVHAFLFSSHEGHAPWDIARGPSGFRRPDPGVS